MMAFYSILYEKPEHGIPLETENVPPFFADLNLDQIIDAATLGKQEYRLPPFFYRSLRNHEAILYRHEIFRDIEQKTLFESLTTFAQKIRVMRGHLALAEKLYYPYQKKRWFLDAVETYCEAVLHLSRDLSTEHLRARAAGVSRLRRTLRCVSAFYRAASGNGAAKSRFRHRALLRANQWQFHQSTPICL
ncbi:DNA mismatch repair protein MutS domain protein [Candidatus Moduliflexus flocculans]|uniref:DNA mismatch repair protein MutS domain protein n=1 Tax=Candidatus Moduliflexus flocculans TaxID=1499966 RepID=A0A081BS05_9BACT|nr:DNA mismatch repair protein MutS domain protein [Candidatus Moduliflexus flocculans]